MIVVDDKGTFNYDHYAGVSIQLSDEQGHGGYVMFGESNGGPKVDFKKLAFVAETVAVEGWPATTEDKDQTWFKESSADLLKLVASIGNKIRIRELTGKEQSLIDHYKKNLESKLVFGKDALESKKKD